MENNELNISLIYQPVTKVPPFWVKILLTFIMLSVIGLYVYLYLIDKQSLLIVIMYAILGALGVYQVFTGKPIQRIFGDAYIKINEELIRYKQSIFTKEIVLYWENVEAVISKPGRLLVETKQNLVIEIPFRNMQYEYVQEFKAVLKEILSKKGIENDISL